MAGKLTSSGNTKDGESGLEEIALDRDEAEEKDAGDNGGEMAVARGFSQLKSA